MNIRLGWFWSLLSLNKLASIFHELLRIDRHVSHSVVGSVLFCVFFLCVCFFCFVFFFFLLIFFSNIDLSFVCFLVEYHVVKMVKSNDRLIFFPLMVTSLFGNSLIEKLEDIEEKIRYSQEKKLN